jgi:hypothetical protein
MNTVRTANANLAPRCQHTKMNGQPCCAPARRGRKYCVFHEAAHAKRPGYQVRLVEDAMSLQFALFQVMRALDDHEIDPKRAALKLYALQIAASNLKRLQQEIDYNPADDPAREKSLAELLLDQLQIPTDEDGNEIPPDQFAGYSTPPVPRPGLTPNCQAPINPRSRAGMQDVTPDDLRPQAGDRFTIEACADPYAYQPEEVQEKENYSTMASTSPAVTEAPSATMTCLTVPFLGDLSSFCIFMASTTSTPCPDSTSVPAGKITRTTLPGMGASSFCGPSPVAAAALRLRSERGSRTSTAKREFFTQ